MAANPRPSSADLGAYERVKAMLAKDEPTYVVSTAPSHDSKRWTATPPLTRAAFLAAVPHIFVAATFTGVLRRTADLIHCTLLVLDEDDGRTFLERIKILDTLGYAYAYWETKSSTPEQPRYRLVLFPSRPMTAEEKWLVSKALMQMLEWGQDECGALAVQFMYGPGPRPVTAADGSVVDVDALLIAANEMGIEPRRTATVDAEPWDGTPPTVKQIDKGRTVWQKYMGQMENPAKAGYHGRSHALISMLPMLLRFTLAGVLDAHDVIEGMWEASQAAPADHPFERREFDGVVGRAWVYAENDGALVPQVVEAEDEFGDAYDDDSQTVVVTGRATPSGRLPDAYFSGRTLLVRILADDVLATIPLAVEQGSGVLWAYQGGVWRPNGEDRVAEIVIDLLGNRFVPGHLTNVLTVLQRQSGMRRIQPGPTPRWINMTNGLVDWRTGTLYGHMEDAMSINQIPWAYEPGAECPLLDTFFREVLPADLLEPCDTGPGYLYELIGYLMLSGNPLHRAVLLDGTGGRGVEAGRNGKGVFLKVLKALVGDENACSVTPHNLAESRFAAMELRGRLLNVAGDLNHRHIHDTGTIKKITAGDVVMAEAKHKSPIKFEPYAVSVFAYNEVFTASDSSAGWLARFEVLPFIASSLGARTSAWPTGSPRPTNSPASRLAGSRRSPRSWRVAVSRVRRRWWPRVSGSPPQTTRCGRGPRSTPAWSRTRQSRVLLCTTGTC